jgi:ribonuclease Z
MECLLVGTGGMMPLPERHLNALWVRVGGAGYLVDCGEGTQVAMKQWRTGFRALTALAITHLHGDHVLGIPGVLMCRTHAEATEPLVVLGPVGVRRFIENTIADLRYRVGFPLRFVEIDVDALSRAKEPALVHEDEHVRIFALPLAHGTPCLGYRLEEPPRPGKFNPAAARSAGVPEGPLWGRLQQGETVTTPDGREVRPAEVLGPARRGRSCALVTDTVPTKNVYRLAGDVDVAFLEGMFLERDFDQTDDKAHMTAAKAARIGRDAGARRTVLVHLSPRYTRDDLAALGAEARAENDTAEVGRDGARYEIPLPD